MYTAPFLLTAFEADLAQSLRLSIAGTVRIDGTLFALQLQIQDPSKVLKLPKALALRPGSMAHDLWKATCAEIFFGSSAAQYLEFNFSPDGRWNVYLFDDYRKRSSEEMEVRLDVLQWKKSGDVLKMEASGQGLPFVPKQFNPTFVAEVDHGVIHLALKHPTGKPDFHQRDCFVNATRD